MGFGKRVTRQSKRFPKRLCVTKRPSINSIRIFRQSFINEDDGREKSRHSNVYQMNKIFYQYMKAFWRLGLFKEGNPFQIWWESIKKLWLDSNCDHLRFMNKVWNYKSPKSNSLDGTSEQPSEKMSLGENGKCPSSFNPLSRSYELMYLTSYHLRRFKRWKRFSRGKRGML